MSRVILTQAAPRVERIARRLAERGHEVVALPSRRIVALESAAGWADGPQGLSAWDWVVFVSPGAIEVAIEALAQTWPVAVGIAVIGPGSVEALGAQAAVPPDARIVRPAHAPYDAQSLMGEAPFAAPAGLRVLVIRGERGRTDWIEPLRAAGASVDVRTLYRTQALEPSDDGLRRLREWASDGGEAVFVFTGVESVATLEALLGDPAALDWAHAQCALAVHRRIVDALRERGWRDTRVVEPGEQGMLTGIEST